MLTDWIAVLSALIAATGLVFGAFELHHIRQQRAQEERLAIEGVSVSWQPLVAPKKPGDDGFATWVYKISVRNPGRFPISGVEVEMDFPTPFRRKHSGGEVDRARSTLVLEQPVIHGGAERRWDRTLIMDYADASRTLSKNSVGVVAVVHFIDARGVEHTTRWPQRPEDRSAR